MPVRKILLLNGPNINLLGTREPHIYGSETLPSLISSLSTHLSSLTPSVELLHFQTNHEGQLVDRIHAARLESIDAIIINPAAFTHYSVALRDALIGVNIPFVEVHISNTHKREEFRHKSFLSDKAEGVIMGLGTYGYKAAADWMVGHMKAKI